jgi:hypothetical protein
MRKIIIAFSLCLTVVAASQDRKPEIVLRPSGPAPHWDEGKVEGRTYKNTSVGIELTPPPGLEFGSPELKGNPGSVQLLVTVTAVGEYKLLTARKVMAFYADALAYYPSTRRSTDAYMLRIVRSQQGDGYQPEGNTSQDRLGGVPFTRQDFKKGIVYESVFVRACDAQAFVFIFGGADQETVNSLSAATELKLDPVTSGCISNAVSPMQK